MQCTLTNINVIKLFLLLLIPRKFKTSDCLLTRCCSKLLCKKGLLVTELQAVTLHTCLKRFLSRAEAGNEMKLQDNAKG